MPFHVAADEQWISLTLLLRSAPGASRQNSGAPIWWSSASLDRHAAHDGADARSAAAVRPASPAPAMAGCTARSGNHSRQPDARLPPQGPLTRSSRVTGLGHSLYMRWRCLQRLPAEFFSDFGSALPVDGARKDMTRPRPIELSGPRGPGLRAYLSVLPVGA